jgi:chaperone BCS1
VFLPNNDSERIVADVAVFAASQAWYIERGIPWRRGYLFHGVPGSGKTSLISALAGHFRMNLYILNLGSPYLSDDNLTTLLSRVPGRSFVLLEDIDAAFNQRDKSGDARNKLTFSGLLNALDGAGSKDGSMVFMTTNHLEQLDPALTRPGRADFRVEFGYATADQANRMFLAFFPEADGADGFGDRVEAMKLSMAEVQNHLIQHRDSCVRALNSLAKAA